MDGDGTAPLHLAPVYGRPTWVTNASHGGMPNSETVAKAVDEILTTGSTSVLPPLKDKSANAPRRAAVRSVSDSDLTPERTVPSKRTRKPAGRRKEALRTSRPLSVRDQRSLVSEFAAPREEAAAAALSPRSMEDSGRVLLGRGADVGQQSRRDAAAAPAR